MVAGYSLKSRDTGLLRNSRLMGIPEFRCMANDVEMYRRSKVCSIGTPMKLNGTSAFQEKFYYILSDLLWRVCENYNEISQANFYKLYRWFHVTRKLLKPPPPKPDYVSPFAKKEGPKKPMATIRMFTKKNPASYEALLVEQDTMRSRVDPARYLGSRVSLTDSITSSLRLGSPQPPRPGDAFLLTLSENEKAIDAEGGSEGPAVWNARNDSAGKSRTLGTIRSSERSKSTTSASSLQRRVPQPGPTSSAEYLPNISRSQSPTKSRIGCDVGSEVDADVTIVDADAVLDQGSELMLQMQGSNTHPHTTPRIETPPLPSVDVLSKRQLKLIGTHATSPSVSCKVLNIDKPLSDLINSDAGSSSSKRAATAPARPPAITTSALFEMAGQVGERMMVNRARLLFLQHNASQGVESSGTFQPCPKPPTAPPGINRATPLPSVQAFDSKTTSAISSERATTAPLSVTRPTITISRRRSIVRSAKLRSSTSTSQSVPGRTESRVRETQLSEPFIVRAVTPQAPSKTPQPLTPPPTASSLSANSCRFTPDEDDTFDFNDLQIDHTPYKERCAKYKDPHQETIGYLTLDDDEDDFSLSQTPLLNVSQDGFSSLSSFLPSNTSLVS